MKISNISISTQSMHKASTLTKIIGKFAEIDGFFFHIFSNENFLDKIGEL